MLELNNVEIRYQRYILAVKGISMSVPEKGFVTILGPNGSGKSSILKGIAGLLFVERGEITAGTITYEGHRLDKLRPEKIAKKKVVLVPEGRRIFTELTTEENLLAGAYISRHDIDLPSQLDEVYGYFPVLKDRRDKIAGYLSGGELQMLAMGRALMVQPKFLICDEPSLGLAPLLVSQIMEILKTLHQERGVGILLVEQFAENALKLSGYIYILEKGQVVLEGKPHEIENQENVKEFYLGILGSERKKMKDIKFYRRKKRWFSA